ncbi:hypothetical protein [Pseudomonas lopnurensis]|uniref:hypothetical protein n=1 Tax=Pseudomonas lopnurensis TaxID=1477517 RepID=UPI0028AD0CAB|nr:hypothetical protein [Pseudomonas lopnurensis]
MDLKADIEKRLGDFWDKRVISIADDPLSTDELGAPLDSITAVESLIEVGKILSKKVPVDVVIRNGGYETKEQFIELVTTGILIFLGEAAP